MMTRVDSLSTLTFTHTGSPVAANLAVPSGGLVLGTPNVTAGTLALSSGSGSSTVITMTPSGGTLILAGSGAVTLSASSGLNLNGSSPSSLSLANGSTWTTGAGSNINMTATSGLATAAITDTTAATSSQNQSCALSLGSKYWTGSASASDVWTIESLLGSGSNPTSTLSLTHTGTSGNISIQLPVNGTVPTSAGMAGVAGQIIYASGNLYFCSVTGAAGSGVQWNKVTLTSV
jgi:hypothetical protein